MDSPSTTNTALQGILVADATQALAGPFLGMLLGDLGADVIKVERPDGGDQARGWGPPFVGTESTYYLAVNRNKRSLTCNFKSAEGLSVLSRLVDRADVVLTNERRRATLQGRGADYEQVVRCNPRVVYCSITGFGMSGPNEGRAGYDVIAQGMAGLMPITGPQDSVPMRYPASIADLATGMYGLSCILAALLVRERTGQGQYIDLSLLESQAWWGVTQAVAYLMSGRAPGKLENDHPYIVPYGAFKARDGYFIIGCGSEPLWAALCQVLGLEGVRDDPRFCSNRERVLHRAEVRQLLEAKLAERGVDEWCALFDQAEIPAGPINGIPEMLQDRQMRGRGFVVEQDHPTLGALQLLASPLHLSDTPATYRRPPPLLGQHTDEVLAELGYSQAETGELHARGAVWGEPRSAKRKA
jgi:crotonobetainyl-CoA:carnitine CoA-transferase CaiB-like acyl-CoA transferase